jgi:error-prone DNA polymerase
MDYIELQCASYFSFLRACSAPVDLFERAKALGMDTLAIADVNTLAGMVRAHVAAKDAGIRLIPGCHLELANGMALLVYPIDRRGWANLCRLLTLGKEIGGKGRCILDWSDVEDFHEHMIAILVPDQADDVCDLQLRRLKGVFGDRGYMALSLRRRQGDHMRLHALSNLATRHHVPTVVTNDVLYATEDKCILHDVVTCIRNRCTIDAMGDLRHRYADRYLKSPEEMTRLFADYGPALRRTIEIANRCRFSLDQLDYQYPDEKLMPGMTAMEALKRFSWAGAKWRYPEGVPQSVIDLLKHELALIEKLDYAPYFLTVHSIVRYARSRDILCQGRGSAANSCVCYVLGITSVDPARNDLLFERFISEERREPPDIDVDFEHQRREDVMQWIPEQYGKAHSAVVAVVTRFRARRAMRDSLKVLGFPEDTIKTLGKSLRHLGASSFDPAMAAELNINVHDRRIRLAFELHLQLLDMPRQLSQHPGGWVLTRDRLDELVPIEPARMVRRRIIEWDKDDIDELKWMKVDCLALGMMSCMKRCFDLLVEHKGLNLDLSSIPPEDPKTYAMIRRAETTGVFQIESRAQMSMLPRTRPRTFYDLVIQVAIVRPGPIQGDMVHPYLRRLNGEEEVTFPSPELEGILGKTKGVPLFQEQAMRVVIVCAGFSPGLADQVRRRQATFKATGGLGDLSQQIIDGMLKNGYTEEFAMTLVKQLEGFGSYGFPESHAFSFAIIAEASSWMKCHHPDVFLAAILNSQPMGFYAPKELIREAQRQRVEIRPICVNKSRWDCTLEPGSKPGTFAVRLGFRLINKIRSKDIGDLILYREQQAYRSVADLGRRSQASVSTLRRLALVDVYQESFGMARRAALAAVRQLRNGQLSLFDSALDDLGQGLLDLPEPNMTFRPMTAGAEMIADYQHLGFSLKGHILSFLRPELKERGFITCKDAMASKDKRYVQVAGIVTVRQRPGSANGVIFITLQDESGDANVIVWDKVGVTQKQALYDSQLMLITGFIQKEGEVVHLIARSIVDLSYMLSLIGEREETVRLPHQPEDEFRNGGPGFDHRVPLEARQAVNVRSRDFR